MSNRVELTTVNSVKCAVRMAKAIFILPRFGVSERWLKISKLEANELLHGMDKNQTPEDMEMFTGIFGTYDTATKSLYLG